MAPVPSEIGKMHHIGNVKISGEVLPPAMKHIRLWNYANPIKTKNPVPYALGVGHPDRQSRLLDSEKHLDRLDNSPNVVAAKPNLDSSRHLLLLLTIRIPVVMPWTMYV